MPYADETELSKLHEAADDVLKSFNQSAPRYMESETSSGYQKRLAARVQQHAPSMKDINLRESVGTAFSLIEKQIYAEARREAERPTNIPDGELRQVTKYDATGRPFYEFHGRCGTWMNDFSNGCKKRVVGIKQDPNVKYTLTR
jgi:hypothetical protein